MECSRATIERTIEDMRDNFGAPLNPVSCLRKSLE